MYMGAYTHGYTFDCVKIAISVSDFLLSSLLMKSINFEHECEDRMKKLQDHCVSWLVYFTGAAQLLLVCGQSSPAGMFNFHDLCQFSQSNLLIAWMQQCTCL